MTDAWSKEEAESLTRIVVEMTIQQAKIFYFGGP